ncbi:unnamed protein product [Lactuca virosa]|uniref:Uncharacterized protein n=1 Tax=Lactuca virosa TaxID=75947 RepID=A0AAU9NEU4_9ASTR|nr:unnamed protein product [Lactuca virosa]
MQIQTPPHRTHQHIKFRPFVQLHLSGIRRSRDKRRHRYRRHFQNCIYCHQIELVIDIYLMKMEKFKF